MIRVRIGSAYSCGISRLSKVINLDFVRYACYVLL